MTTEHLHPLNFLLLYKFTPAQTFNLPFADLQIPIHARFFPFSPIFHILSETLPFFGLLLWHCWCCLSLVVLLAYKKCRDYVWNHHLISPKIAIFALIHRTGRADLFTNLYNCFLTFVRAFNSGFTAILNGAITLSLSVKALFFLHCNTSLEETEYGSSFPWGIHHHLLQLYFFMMKRT